MVHVQRQPLLLSFSRIPRPLPVYSASTALAASAVLLPQLQTPPQMPPSTASHSNNAENELYRLNRLSNAVPTTAASSMGTKLPVSSQEVRVSLPSHESSDCLGPGLLRGPAESIVTAPICAAHNAECCFSKDIDKTMFEDIQVKARSWIPQSMDIMPDATSRDPSRWNSTSTLSKMRTAPSQNSEHPYPTDNPDSRN